MKAKATCLSALLGAWRLSQVAGVAIQVEFTTVDERLKGDVIYQWLCTPFGKGPWYAIRSNVPSLCAFPLNVTNSAIYNTLVDTCNGSHLDTSDLPEVYPPLTRQTANACSCSLEGYNLMAACS